MMMVIYTSRKRVEASFNWTYVALGLSMLLNVTLAIKLIAARSGL